MIIDETLRSELRDIFDDITGTFSWVELPNKDIVLRFESDGKRYGKRYEIERIVLQPHMLTDPYGSILYEARKMKEEIDKLMSKKG